MPHFCLLHNLKYFGLHGSLLTWISNFLQGWVQNVILDGESSTQSPVSSGVPQGTVLGPLLFLAYINDLPDCISEDSRVRLFADDSVVYRVINNNDDATQLQQDLNALQEWERKWLMEFHPEKCQVLRITKRCNPVKFTYSIHNHPLEVVSSAKYLGVELSDNLSWNRNIDSIAAKGKRSLGFLRRNLGCCPHDVKTHCYNTLMRPIMEYTSRVWDPTTKKNITKVESVQRSAARYVMNNYSRESSVTNMLSDLEWKSLHHRRAISKVTMLYWITNHLVDIPDTQLIPSSSTTRGNSQKFLVPASRTTLLKGSFFPDTIRLWNNLPQEVVDSPTLDAFRSRVSGVTLIS